MPEPRIPCPAEGCKGSIKVRNSGKLYAHERTGLLMKECLVRCDTCQRKGKMLVTLDIALYMDALHVEPAPLSVAS